MRFKEGVFALLLAALVAALLVSAQTALCLEPFGSLGELQRQLADGRIADAIPEGRFIVARYDDYGHVTYQVAALKKAPPAIPSVVIVGGSAVRECLTSDDALAAAITRQCGRKVRVLTLACAMQRLPSTLAIIDNLPRGSGVVVIGVHHLTFVATESDATSQLTGYPLMLASPALREITADRLGYDPPHDIRPGLRRFIDWYARKRGAPAFEGGERAYVRHRYDQRSSLSTSGKQGLVPNFPSTLGSSPGGPFFSCFDFNAALLQRCVAVARAKGYEVLLMQDPINREVVGDAYTGYERRYLPVVRRIVRRQTAHYVDFNAQAALVDADFFDLFHLYGSGRAKWTPKLGAAVARILNDHPPELWRRLQQAAAQRRLRWSRSVD